MKPNISLFKLMVVCLMLLVTACTSTQVISSWSISNPPAGTMNKVLVLGVMANRETKDQIEQAMATALNSHGVNANAAISEFGPGRFREMKEDEIVRRLKKSSYTSVMIVSLVAKEKQKEYVQGTYATYPVMGYYGFYRRYWFMYDRVYSPGYYRTTTNWVLEADIYTIDEDELIYSTQTRSYDPDNAKTLAESFAKSIADELSEKGIITTQK